ncbi:medium chain dehydrogenase/reductase family protein (plasmid) [Ensifer adhaerens]|uniref:medium chain dehydrogenase/reductase family protein n=1 Tax=Ensifer adhaerens TaxID=106592 RepID=UPI0023A997AD|nr:medium chain dehydrogenase/reductase family protein [Ensifer adhaerens]WDZ81600.1 medium chain dehydrogenase/reductase family protein [Ensifer adhaerens]
MKSIRIVARRFGGPEVLETVQEEAPEPGQGEVRVRVFVAGVSFAEMLMREGIHPEKTTLPFTPGWDIVGAVEKAGEGASKLTVGQIVAALPIHGGYAQYICLPESELVPVPAGLDPAEAVSLVLNYVTAHQMIHRLAHATAGQRALVHGAAGGVGTALLQLGRLACLDMYGTASLADHQIVSDLGATPIDYQKSDFVEEIHQLTGGGVDIVFDGVGEANVWRSFQALKPGGCVIAYGFTSFLQKGKLSGGLRYRLRGILRPAWYALRAFLSPGRRRILPYSIQYLKRWRPAWFREDLSTLLNLLRDKKIKPMIADRIPLGEARRAQELIGRGSVRGKLVLVCNAG